MKLGYLRFSIPAVLALLSAVSAASGQTITLSFSGSGNSGGNGSGPVGSGTGTLTPGGTAALSFTGSSSSDNCTSAIQFSLNFLIDANDSLALFFNGQIPASLQNGGSASGTLNGTLTVTGGTGAYSGKGGTGTAAIAVQLSSKTFTYMLTGSLTLAGPVVPVASVTPSGIVPVFSDVPTVQPGSWISIYGNNLASATTVWTGNFPTSLGSVSVSIDGKPSYLWFVSSGQINLQVPSDSNSGCVPVVVTTPNGSVTTAVDLETISPSFSLLGNSYVAGVIPTPNGGGAYGGGTYDLVGPSGAFPYNTRPVKRGETVALFGVGFGPTNPSVPAGQVYSGAAQSKNNVQVYLCSNGNGNNCIQAAVAGNSAYLVGAGLFQLNVTVPLNAPTGNLSVQANVGGSGGNNGVGTSGDINVLLAVQ